MHLPSGLCVCVSSPTRFIDTYIYACTHTYTHTHTHTFRNASNQLPHDSSQLVTYAQPALHACTDLAKRFSDGDSSVIQNLTTYSGTCIRLTNVYVHTIGMCVGELLKKEGKFNEAESVLDCVVVCARGMLATGVSLSAKNGARKTERMSRIHRCVHMCVCVCVCVCVFVCVCVCVYGSVC